MLLLLAAAATGCATVQPTALIIKRISPYQEGIAVSQHVRENCRLEQDLSGMVELFSRKRYDEIQRVDEIPPATTADILTMKIMDVYEGKPFGTLPPPTAVTAEEVLTRNGAIIGTFTSYHSGSGFSPTPGYMGYCSGLQLAVKAIGKSVATWLAELQMTLAWARASGARDRRKSRQKLKSRQRRNCTNVKRQDLSLRGPHRIMVPGIDKTDIFVIIRTKPDFSDD